MSRVLNCTATLLLLLAGLPLARGADAPQDAELNVPAEKIAGGTPGKMMHGYLKQQASQCFDRWKADYEKRTQSEDIAVYQKQMRAKFVEAIGGFPERTPLEPQVSGTISRPGYRVEKIIFQSQPKHYVTALLFLPDSPSFKSPYPGVIIPCGHSDLAKGYGPYQSMGAFLALNGMVGLVFDPIDQGERAQYLGEGGWPALRGTKAHSNLGIGSILLGRNTARFEIWDGMRAIDYLQSRPEVDPKRIGCSGCSGGGTQTSYLMALDDRIGCAAPSCYITSWPRLLATEGPQDAEQNIFGQFAFGMDHADYIMMRAPSPVLLLTATNDFFDITGGWDSLRYAKRLYTRLGFPERVDILEADDKHGYSVMHHEGAGRWMSRWLLGKDQPITQPEIVLLTEQEYQCTPDGKAMLLPGARSVYDLNEDYENDLAKRREAAWKGDDRAGLLEKVRQLAGIRKLAELPNPKVESLGIVAKPGYTIERLAIQPEDGVTLAALLFSPEKPKPGSVVLYVHQNGKSADAGVDGPIERLVKAGESVLAVDLRGTGQTQAALRDGYSDEFQDAITAYLLGRSFVGMRAEDVLVCARYAAQRAAEGKDGTVRLIAVGNVGIPALHAAALEPALFQNVRISQMLASWSHVIHSRLNKGIVTHVVHNALTHYDLPNLAAVLGDRLTIEQSINALGTPIVESPGK